MPYPNAKKKTRDAQKAVFSHAQIGDEGYSDPIILEGLLRMGILSGLKTYNGNRC